jgi:hypothetical protein
MVQDCWQAKSLTHYRVSPLMENCVQNKCQDENENGINTQISIYGFHVSKDRGLGWNWERTKTSGFLRRAPMIAGKLINLTNNKKNKDMADIRTILDEWSVKDLEDNSSIRIMVENCTEIGNYSKPGIQVHCDNGIM